MKHSFSLFRFLSIRAVAQGIADIAKRFPVVLAGTVAIAVVGILLVESTEYRNGLVNFSDATEDALVKVLMMLGLGVMLLTASTLYSERKKLSRLFHFGLQAACIALLVIYYFVLPDISPDPAHYHIIRYVLFDKTSILLLLIAPFIVKPVAQGLWQHGKTLFIRLIISLVFAGVLWGGIALSVEAVRFLFELTFDRVIYLELWIVCASIFAPWIFLSGIPNDFEPLEKDTSYPRILEGFTKFILLPLLALFTLVLYAYLAKILITQEWPNGGVVRWIISFTSFGLATFLLKYPLERKYQWVRRIFTIFFALLIPIIAVHFIAIGLRVNQYGITLNRFYIMLYGAWLLGMTIYFLANKMRNIIVIPASLAIILFVFSIGPWSAFAISERSQVNRLEKLFEKNGLIMEGELRESTKELPVEDCRSIRSTVNYLHGTYGFEAVERLMGTPERVADAFGTNYERIEAFYKKIGANCDEYFPFADSPNREDQRQYYYADKMGNEATELGNRTFLVRDIYLDTYNRSLPFKIEGVTATFALNNNSVSVTREGTTLATFDLGEKAKSLQSAYPYKFNVPQKELTLTSETSQAIVHLYLDRLEFSKKGDAPTVNNIAGSAVIQLK